MPEGDTIFRTARTLHRALAGSVVTGFETQLPALARVDYDRPLAGRVVEFARATGKWLQIGFSGDLILLTHMLMSGSWHIYRPGEAWQLGRTHMRVSITTASIVAVAFKVQIAEFHSFESLARRAGFNALGPDLLAAHFDEAAAVRLLAARSDLELGVALLTQSTVAGLGNVYKSEVCFLAQVNPFCRVGELSPARLSLVVGVARKLLMSNVGLPTAEGVTDDAGMRRTTRSFDPEERLWVYRRNGQPCRECGTLILSRAQGEDARTTFWCPACQPR